MLEKGAFFRGGGARGRGGGGFRLCILTTFLIQRYVVDIIYFAYHHLVLGSGPWIVNFQPFDVDIGNLCNIPFHFFFMFSYTFFPSHSSGYSTLWYFLIIHDSFM